MITIKTNLIEVTEMHKDLLNLTTEDAFEIYSILCIKLATDLIIIDNIFFVEDDIFLTNYTNCFLKFLVYLLEKDYSI